MTDLKSEEELLKLRLKVKELQIAVVQEKEAREKEKSIKEELNDKLRFTLEEKKKQTEQWEIREEEIEKLRLEVKQKKEMEHELKEKEELNIKLQLEVKQKKDELEHELQEKEELKTKLQKELVEERQHWQNQTRQKDLENKKLQMKLKVETRKRREMEETTNVLTQEMERSLKVLLDPLIGKQEQVTDQHKGAKALLPESEAQKIEQLQSMQDLLKKQTKEMQKFTFSDDDADAAAQTSSRRTTASAQMAIRTETADLDDEELARRLWERYHKPHSANPRKESKLMTDVEPETRVYIEKLKGFRAYGFVEDKLRIKISEEAYKNREQIKADVEAKLDGKIEVYCEVGFEVEAQHCTGQVVVEQQEFIPGPTPEDSCATPRQSYSGISSATCTLMTTALHADGQTPYACVCTCAHASPYVQERLDSHDIHFVTSNFHCQEMEVQCPVWYVEHCNLIKGDSSLPAKGFTAMRNVGSKGTLETRDILCIPQTAQQRLILNLIEQGTLRHVRVFDDSNREALRQKPVYIVSPMSADPIRARILQVDQSYAIAVRLHGLQGDPKQYMFDKLYELSAQTRVGDPGESGCGVFIVCNQEPMLLAMHCAKEMRPQPISVSGRTLALSFEDNIRQITKMNYEVFIPVDVYDKIVTMSRND